MLCCSGSNHGSKRSELEQEITERNIYFDRYCEHIAAKEHISLRRLILGTAQRRSKIYCSVLDYFVWYSLNYTKITFKVELCEGKQ